MPSVVRIHSCPCPLPEPILKDLSHSAYNQSHISWYVIVTYCCPLKAHKSVKLLTLFLTLIDTRKRKRPLSMQTAKFRLARSAEAMRFGVVYVPADRLFHALNQ